MNHTKQFLFFVFIIFYIFNLSSSDFLNSHATETDLRNLQSDGETGNNGYNKIVVNAWATDVNIKILTTKEDAILQRLTGKNVTDVVATDRAFAVRIANNDFEAVSAISKFKNATIHDAKNSHPIADGSKTAGVWVVWGDYSDPPDSNPGEDFGGLVPKEVLDLLQSDSRIPAGVIDKSSKTYGHVIYANDICPMKNAFVGILSGKLFCWGNKLSCTGLP